MIDSPRTVSGRRFEVTWFVTPDQDLYHASKLLSGFCELRDDGTIRLRMASYRPPASTSPYLVYLRVESPEGAFRNVVVDLHDRGDLFDRPGLSFADVYFKRSFDAGEVGRLEGGRSVRPFGLNFACLSKSAARALVRCAFMRFSARYREGLLLGASDLARDLRFLFSLPRPEVFSARSRDERRPVALFQTRVWPPELHAPDWTEINAERAALVRALRLALGERFVGGLIADEFARNKFPDIVARSHTHRAAYAELMRSITVGVYTRGLHDSLAFKLAEYLAAGLCIVSEPLRFELPAPLQPGFHYLPFETHEECVANCVRLLEHPSDARKMQWANLEYYQQHVAPRIHAMDIIRRSFA